MNKRTIKIILLKTILSVFLMADLLVLIPVGQAADEDQEKKESPQPSVFVAAVPLSSSPNVGVDLSPGLVGLVMNVINVANTVRQVASDRIKVIYLEDGHTLLQGRICVLRSVEVDRTAELGQLAPGELIAVSRNADRLWSVDAIKHDEQVAMISADHICYEKYQERLARK